MNGSGRCGSLTSLGGREWEFRFLKDMLQNAKLPLPNTMSFNIAIAAGAEPGRGQHVTAYVTKLFLWRTMATGSGFVGFNGHPQCAELQRSAGGLCCREPVATGPYLKAGRSKTNVADGMQELFEARLQPTEASYVSILKALKLWRERWTCQKPSKGSTVCSSEEFGRSATSLIADAEGVAS